MRSPISSDSAPLAEVTRRRLELLSAEIAGARSDGSALRIPVEDDDPPPQVEPLAAGRHARRSVGTLGLVSGWAHDRLPPTLQGRVRLGASQLGVLAITVGLGLAVSAWWVLRSDDGGALVPASSQVASQGAAPSPIVTSAPQPAPASAAPPSGAVVVDMAGKVRRPGIATLPAGARVIDALKAAGGIRPGVDSTSINRARLLVDGEQIVVGAPPPTGAAASAAGSAPAGPSLVNLNTADEASLEELPGIGPVTAQAIVQWREENGGFRSVDELLEVSGIGDATLAELAPHVTL